MASACDIGKEGHSSRSRVILASFAASLAVSSAMPGYIGVNADAAAGTKPCATGINVDSVQTRFMTGTELVKLLREERKLPVNSVYLPNEHPVPILPTQPVSDMIGQLETESGEYQHRIINGRLVIYPLSSALEDTVQLPPGQFQNVPRFRTRSAYVVWLRDNHPAFSTLEPPLSIGTGTGAGTDERISLTPRATVLQHLVELLGNNPQRVFTIEPNAALRSLILNFRLISE